MRRTLSICCVLFAWLCANGAAGNAVCSSRCVKQSCGDAVASKCSPQNDACCSNGCAKCQNCLSEKAEPPTPLASTEALGDGMEGYVLVAENTHEFVLIVPTAGWLDVGHDDGLMRAEPVPLRPPRV